MIKNRKRCLALLLAACMVLVFFPGVAFAVPTVVESGVVTEYGSNLPWRLYDDGTLVVDEGFLAWARPWWDGWSPILNPRSPWDRHHEEIYRIVFTGPITAGQSFNALFANMWNLTSIEGLEYFDTRNATDMSEMFVGTVSLTSVDLSSFDTQNVTNMGSMFLRASNLTSLDLSSFDTQNVTYMRTMFAGMSRLASLDVSSFDTSNVTHIEGMFSGTHSLTNLDLSNFDTRSVINMEHMFRNMTSLRMITLGEYFEFQWTDWWGQPVGASLPFISRSELYDYTVLWKNIGTGTIDNPQGNHVFTTEQLMENYDGKTMADSWILRPADPSTPTFAVGTVGVGGAPWRLYFDGNLFVDSGTIRWEHESRPADYFWYGPWSGLGALVSNIVFTGPVNAGISPTSLFLTLSALESIDGLEYFDTSNVIHMDRMFHSINNIANLDLSHFDTSSVTSMYAMFAHSRLVNLDLSSWDTSNVTQMSIMFAEAPNLAKLDLSNFNTSNVLCMGDMFRSATSLRQLALGEYFDFGGSTSANLPPVPSNATYTGYWQNVGTGTSADPQGVFVFTSDELMASFHGPTMADTWVWQPRDRAISVSVTGVTIAGAATRNMTPGNTLSLTATVNPANATNQSVTWTSSNPAVAMVSANGTVTAVSAGTATITVTTADGNRTASVAVTVTAPTVSVTGVTIGGAATRNMTTGNTLSLSATVNPANATNRNVTWTSSNPAVATVSANGTVTAVSAGTATITVRTADGNHTASVAVTVTAPTVSVTGVTIGGAATRNMTTGNTLLLLPTVNPANATNRNVTWTSSDTAVATVSVNGRVTAVSAGTATITVRTADGNHTASVAVTVTAPRHPFVDLSSSNAWYASAVQFIYERGIMHGIDATTFAPQSPLTRAQVVTVLYRLEGEPNVQFSSVFSDVQAGQWYSNAVIWANANGIVQGVGGGRFDPNRGITREEFAAMLHRYASFIGANTAVSSGFNLNNFQDHSQISGWAETYALWANYNGLITGTTTITFSPQGLATRAQCAVILMRFVQRLVV